MEYRRNSSVCLCRVSSSCDCVSASTESFKIPKIKDIVYEKFVVTKYSEAKILPKLDSLDGDPLREFRNYVSIVILGTIVFVLLLIFCCGFYGKAKGKKSKSGKKVFLKIWKNETMDIAPLIRNQKSKPILCLILFLFLNLFNCLIV